MACHLEDMKKFAFHLVSENQLLLGNILVSRNKNKNYVIQRIEHTFSHNNRFIPTTSATSIISRNLEGQVKKEKIQIHKKNNGS